MKRIDRQLMFNLASTFSKEFLNNLARETSFIQREGSLSSVSSYCNVIYCTFVPFSFSSHLFGLLADMNAIYYVVIAIII
jgi:hypothetical protein